MILTVELLRFDGRLPYFISTQMLYFLRLLKF